MNRREGGWLTGVITKPSEQELPSSWFHIWDQQRSQTAHICFVYRVSYAKVNTFRIAQHDVSISKMSFLRTFINN